RPIFIYVSKKAADGNPAVRQFVEFYLDAARANELVTEVGYVPLPARAYQLALENFRKRKLGTAFAGGPQVGVTIEDILTAEMTH
ncbi:MAG TPA: hypothetical protein VD713_03755, partial [Sphingomonadales bacterium]|nr:hypothetical protein [Sphingomonadales bacterium]